MKTNLPLIFLIAPGSFKGLNWLLLFLHLGMGQIFAQGSWTAKTNLTGGARNCPTAFAIATKGYVVTGEAMPGMQQDLWEWDQPTNAWTQKANFPDTARKGAVAFSIGTKGYLGTGFSGPYHFTFWQWDQPTNTWSKKADVPGGVRGFAVGMSIGSKGYIGTGYLYGPVTNDWWEYDPVSDTWTQKANFGGAARYAAAGFSIGTKGYIGTGVNMTSGFPPPPQTYYNDFWEWDQGTNVWTQKANFPGSARSEGVGFHIGKFGYMGTGTTLIGSGTVSSMYRYDQANNTWNAIPNFAGGLRETAASFNIGCYGYVTCGFINDQFMSTLKNDLWEYYDPSDTTCGCSVIASANGNQTICAGQNATLTASGGSAYSWNTGNTSSSVVVSPTSTSSYTVVVSSGPSCTDIASVTVTVAPPPVASVNSNQTICAGQAATLTASGGNNYSWNTGATTSSITISPTSTTNYSVTVSNGPSCSSTAFATITVSASPTPSISGNSSLCQGDVATLIASGGTNYSWSTGATNSVITVNPSSSASYTVVVTNVNGCTAVTSVNVTVSPPPVASVTGTTICSGQNATLTASGGGNYSWSTGQTLNPISVSPSSNTTYTVVVSVGSCTDTASATVNVVPGVTAIISGNTALCVGDTTTLTASGGGNYSWSNGSTSNTITVNPSSTTTYTVVTSNGSGCTASATSAVTVSPPPVASANGTTVCGGQATLLSASGGASYSWSNGATTASITISPTVSSTYSVIVSIGSCSDTATASVGVNPNPTAVAYSSVVIALGQNTTLGASGGGSYLWSNGDTDANITVAPLTTTEYCVTVTNSFGCSDSDCVWVTVQDMDCSFSAVGEFFIPNAFSPNGDGENETIKLSYGNTSCIKTFHLIIYNRWGEKVFEADSPGDEWDGTYRTQPEESALFVWYLKAELVSGEKIEKQGNISLFR